MVPCAALDVIPVMERFRGSAIAPCAVACYMQYLAPCKPPVIFKVYAPVVFVGGAFERKYQQHSHLTQKAAAHACSRIPMAPFLRDRAMLSTTALMEGFITYVAMLEVILVCNLHVAEVRMHMVQ